jgi:general secretion pathway protein L
MEQLIVRLGSDKQSPVFWIVWSDTEQEIIASGELPDADALSTLTERAGSRPVTALAPTSDILLKWVSLPPKAGRKVIAAIPYMLEDELSTDVSEQFFALGPKSGNEQAVAIVHRNQMQAWKDMLDSAGLNCDKLIPDVLALPAQENGWSLLTVGSQLLIRQDQWSGMQGEQDWLLPAMSHFAKQQEDPLNIYDYTGLDIVKPANVEWHTQTLEMPMHVLVKGSQQAGFNLFQGEYKAKRQVNTHWQQWRLAAILAVIALTLSLVDRGLTLNSLANQQQALAAQIEEQVQKGFPNIGPYRDVRRKVTSELAKLEQNGGGITMLAMMNQLADAFAQTQVKPQSLRFDGQRGELRMQAVASNFEALERFTNQAREAGFTVEQGAINNRDNQVIGSLAIRG